MRRLGVVKWILAVGVLGAGFGAAPAAPSHYAIEQGNKPIRESWEAPDAVRQPNAQGWSGRFGTMIDQLKGSSTVTDENGRRAALDRVSQVSVALKGTSWAPAVELREGLRSWLRPRVRLAWA